MPVSSNQLALSRVMVCSVLGVTLPQLHRWLRDKLVSPEVQIGSGRERRYSLTNLYQIALIQELVGLGVGGPQLWMVATAEIDWLSETPSQRLYMAREESGRLGIYLNTATLDNSWIGVDLESLRARTQRALLKILK